MMRRMRGSRDRFGSVENGAIDRGCGLTGDVRA